MTVGPHSRGQRGIRNTYPVTSGTTAETTKTEGRQINLTTSEGSSISDEKKKLL